MLRGGNDLFDIPVIPHLSSQRVTTKDHKMTGSKNKQWWAT